MAQNKPTHAYQKCTFHGTQSSLRWRISSFLRLFPSSLCKRGPTIARNVQPHLVSPVPCLPGGSFSPPPLRGMGHPFCPRTVFGFGATISPPNAISGWSDRIDTSHSNNRNLCEDLDPRTNGPDPLGHEHPKNCISNPSIWVCKHWYKLKDLRRNFGWVLPGHPTTSRVAERFDDERAHKRRHGDVREACEGARDGADAWEEGRCVNGTRKHEKEASKTEPIRRRRKLEPPKPSYVVLCCAVCMEVRSTHEMRQKRDLRS